MNTPLVLSRAKVSMLMLVAATTGAQPRMPDAAEIARQAASQAPRSATAIDKAELQSRTLRQAIPGVGVSPALPAIDPGEIAQRFQDMAPAEESALFVLVSLSMPRASIERLASQAGKAGATLVLRGMVDDSLTKTASTIADFLHAYPGTQFQIDPTVFRRFAVQQVPAFVLSIQAPDTNTCGQHCDPRNTFTTVAGDVSIDYALEYLAKQPEKQFAHLAERRLQRLRSAP